jgi:hypothetical protein
MHPVRHADPTRLGKSLQARCNIDAISENVVAVDDDVTDIDANTELDPTILRDGIVALGHAPLDFYGAAHGINGTDKLDEDAITGAFDNPTVVLSNLEIDESVPMSLKRFVRAFLVNAHQPAVTSHVSCEDGG